jgi:hypothetical protein
MYCYKTELAFYTHAPREDGDAREPGTHACFPLLFLLKIHRTATAKFIIYHEAQPNLAHVY